MTKSGSFVERQQPGQFLASRLVGTAVYGSNNERIGDVNDILVDRDGRAQAIVVGVGGFLGIGEKDVAVQFSAVEFASGDAGRTGTAAGTSAPGSAATGTTATPDRIIIRMTREQLDAAPQFARMGDNAAGARTTTNPPASAPATGTGTSPSGTTR